MKAELNINIDINIPGFPEMASAAHAFMLRLAGIGGTTSPVTAQKTPPKVETAPVVTQPQAPVTTAPVTPPAAAPVSEAVLQQQAPTAAPVKYTLPQLQAGAAQLVKDGKRQEGLALLSKYNVQTVLDLKEEQFGTFATDLRALGVKI